MIKVCSVFSLVTSIETRSYMLFDPQAKKVIISRDVVFDEHGIYQSELIKLKLKEDKITIDGESHSRSLKEDEVKKKPKWFERSHLENNMLDRNFERRITRSQINRVNYSLMT
jgi:hypothetical protein